MKKLFATCSLALLLITSCGAQTQDTQTSTGNTMTTQKPWEIVYTAYEKQAFYAKRGHEPIVLFFYGEHDAASDLLDKALQAQGNMLMGKVTLYKASFEREQELKSEFHVGLPDTVVVLNAKGEVVASQSGVVTFSQLQQLIQMIL